MNQRRILILLLIILFCSTGKPDDLKNVLLGPSSSSLLLAQGQGEEYDPFSDYSEFEESEDEEADINFFRNGRLFNMGMIVGSRSFTDVASKIYRPSSAFGLFATYFFDLRFALQFSFTTGDHVFAIVHPEGSVSGNLSITSTSFNVKYYFNTQNVTRGLASLNPYIIGGFSQFNRTFTIIGDDTFGRDASSGSSLGLGLEIPMLRNKMYLGVEGSYYMVNFPNENQEIIINNTIHTGIYPRGDLYTIYGIIGINF